MLKKLNNGKKALKKKVGDDKLVISLVLIAVGVVLCFVYREQITEVIQAAIDSLKEKIDSMFNTATTFVFPKENFKV